MNSIKILPTLIIASLGHFIVDFMLGIWPVYKTMMNIDLATAGFIVAGCAFLGEGGQLVSGALTDRGFGKWMILLGAGLATAICFIPYVEGGGIALILILCVYIGSGAFHPAAAGVVAMLSHPRKGLLLSIFAAAGSLGLAMSQIVFSQLFYAERGHTAWLAVPFLLFAFYAVTCRIDVKPKKVRPRLHFNDLIAIAKNVPFRRLYFTILCMQIVAWAFIFLLPDILVERHYVRWICFGGGHMAFMLGGAIFAVPMGIIADRFDEQKVMLGGISITTMALAIFLTYETAPVWLVLGLLFVAGGCSYASTCLSLSLGNRIIPGQPGLVGACLMGLAWIIAEAVAPFSAGVLTKFFSEHAAARSFSLIACLLQVAIVNLWRVSAPEKENVSITSAPLSEYA